MSDEICTHCAAAHCSHQHRTLRCPAFGFTWRETTFEPEHRHQFNLWITEGVEVERCDCGAYQPRTPSRKVP